MFLRHTINIIFKTAVWQLLPPIPYFPRLFLSLDLLIDVCDLPDNMPLCYMKVNEWEMNSSLSNYNLSCHLYGRTVKTTKMLNQDGQSPGWNTNPGPPKYETRVLTAWLYTRTYMKRRPLHLQLALTLSTKYKSCTYALQLKICAYPTNTVYILLHDAFCWIKKKYGTGCIIQILWYFLLNQCTYLSN